MAYREPSTARGTIATVVARLSQGDCKVVDMQEPVLTADGSTAVGSVVDDEAASALAAAMGAAGSVTSLRLATSHLGREGAARLAVFLRGGDVGGAADAPAGGVADGSPGAGMRDTAGDTAGGSCCAALRSLSLIGPFGGASVLPVLSARLPDPLAERLSSQGH